MISFTLPWALIGLVAAALPLLLHLVRRHEAPEVFFPAVRYLEDATREQRRRLKFRHWWLLLVRTLLITALVLAAAGPTVRRNGFGPHAPAALVLVLDNSAASGAVIDGEPVLAGLVRAADRVLDRATLSDRVWIITADGVSRTAPASELRRQIGALQPQPVRLDLGEAVAAARDLVHGSGRLGEVVVITPLQRSALTAARGAGNVLVLRPDALPPVNHGVLSLTASTQPWSPVGGRVTLTIVSSDTAAVPVTLAVGGRTLREVLVPPGTPMVERTGAEPPGWIVITAALPPDEFRFDDTSSIVVRVAPPAQVQWDSSDRYIAAAAEVLAADGRIRSGSDIHFGTLGPGVSVVMPPNDPARVGALNRALAARGIAWHFGQLVVAAERIDSGAMTLAREGVERRYTLERSGGGGEVLATVGGAPWLVRAGDVLLLGSRLDPTWTALPLSASFVPFVDALLAGAARGEAVTAEVMVGASFRLSDRTTGLAHNGIVTAATGGSVWVPRDAGVFYLLVGTDTVGAISVRLDPRVSDLSRATDRDVRALWPRSTVAGLREGPALAFAAGGHSDLRGALLVLAFCCALAETLMIASARRAA